MRILQLSNTKFLLIVSALAELGLGASLFERDRISPASGLVAGLAVYDAAVAALLPYSAVVDGMRGFGLWPATALHLVLLTWCVACLRVRGG
jgi:hypothetical protein